MKKALMFLLLIALTIGFLGCQTTTTDWKSLLPIAPPAFMERLSLSADVIAILASDKPIQYIDESMIVYGDGWGTVIISGETVTTFSSLSLSYTGYYRFFLGFNQDTETIYYLENPINRDSDLKLLTKTALDEDSAGFVHYADSVNFYSSRYLVSGNVIRDSRTDVLFENGETIAFMRLQPGDDLRFYTYQRAFYTTERGCTIKTYEDFAAAPTGTQIVHETYTCGQITQATEENVVIEILQYLTLKGYAIIDDFGVVHPFLFEDYLPSDATVVFQSPAVETWTPGWYAPRFSYEDEEEVLHTVLTDLNFSFVDDVTNFDSFVYVDSTFRLRSNDFYVALGDYLTVNECENDITLQTCTTTLFDRVTHETEQIDGFIKEIDGSIAIIQNDDLIDLVDLTNHQTLASFPIAQNAQIWNGFVLLIYDRTLTLVEISTLASVEFNLLSTLSYISNPYGYVVERDGSYFLLG